MRHFQVDIQSFNRSFYNRQSFRTVFFGKITKQLHAQTDSEKGFFYAFYNLIETCRLHLFHRRSCPSLTGENDFFGFQNHFRIRSHDTFKSQPLHCVFYRSDIARIVIYYCYHNFPFVDGNIFFPLSVLPAAILNARANALKIPSAMWCSFLPYLILMCRFARIPSETALKKSSNISVGISPIFSRLNFTFQTIYGRPPKSIATSAKTSSIGNKNPYLSIPFLSPRASFMACPRHIPTSSIVWCSSTFRSPFASMSKSIKECFEKSSSM